MQIIIIRHGDPDYAIDGLTETGKKEVAALGDYYKDAAFDKVYSSTMGRAYLTAQGIASKEDIIRCDWLREFGHPVLLPDGKRQLNWDFYPSYFYKEDDFFNVDKYLDTEVMKSGQVKEAYEEVIHEFDKVLEENGYARDGRCYRVLKENKKKLVFVCHFGMMSVLASHLLNVPYVVLSNSTCCLPTGVTTFVSEEREEGTAQFRMLSFGDLTHLAKAGLKPSFSARFCETYSSPERH